MRSGSYGMRTRSRKSGPWALYAGWLEFTPDGKTLLTAKRDPYAEGATHRFRRWDVRTGEPRGEAALGSAGGYASYLLSADGKTLFSMRMQPVEPFLRAYDALTGKEERPAPRPGRRVSRSVPTAAGWPPAAPTAPSASGT